MKKLLLSAMTLATAMMSYAQIGTEGFYYDPMNTDFENGLYWWTYEEDPEEPEFKFEMAPTDSGMFVTLWQPKGSYKPFGISFGMDRNDTTQMNTIDISGDQSYAIAIRNYSEYDVNVRVSPQDVNQNSVDVDSLAPDNVGSIYLSNFERQYTASTQPVEPQGTEIYEGTFKGMYASVYEPGTATGTSGDTCNVEADVPYVDAMDRTMVSGFMITLFNDSADPDDCYNPYALDSATFLIEYVLLGDTSTIYADADRDGIPDDMDNCNETFDGTVTTDGCPVGLAELKAEIGLSVAPNPASDIVVVSYIGNGSVALVNAQGATVATDSGYDSSSLSVANLASGIYYAVVTVGDIVVTEAIVVE